ncbi:protease inhibitor I42 family protein [Nocardia sp. NPDC052566]|uniref:protease inhibitor I42 family protein n=1 Tax=Nocardia sp. NPDC052566 TaxID=3364330 RepID=UPI0037CA2594
MRSFLLIPVLGILLVACGNGDSGGSTATSTSVATESASAPVTVGADSDGQPIGLSVGRQLVVVLAGNITTGYSWQRQELDQNIVEQDGDPIYTGYPIPPSSQPIVGVGGTSTWRFTAVTPGVTTLVLAELPAGRPGEPAKRFTLPLTVYR